MIILDVRYRVKQGLREQFVAAVQEAAVIEQSQREQGNICYEYSYPVEQDNMVHLLEIWEDEAALEAHKQAAHFHHLAPLKAQFIEETQIRRFQAEQL